MMIISLADSLRSRDSHRLGKPAGHHPSAHSRGEVWGSPETFVPNKRRSTLAKPRPRLGPGQRPPAVPLPTSHPPRPPGSWQPRPGAPAGVCPHSPGQRARPAGCRSALDQSTAHNLTKIKTKMKAVPPTGLPPDPAAGGEGCPPSALRRARRRAAEEEGAQKRAWLKARGTH